MPLYRYRAYETSGVRVEDTIEAASEREATRRLSGRGLTIAKLEVLERRKSKRTPATDVSAQAQSSQGFSLFGRRLKQDDVVVLARELAIMVESGVPITEALSSLQETSRHKIVRDSLGRVNVEIANGANLSDALRAAPKLFPVFFCDIIRAAEEGGRLAEALETAATQMERSLELRRKVISSLLYPALLLSISVVTAGLLVTVVIPRFGKIFENMGTEVPVTTKILLGASGFLQGHWYYVLGGTVGAIVLFRRLLKNRAFATWWTRLLIRTPIAGDIILKLAVARSLAVLSSMLSCNVPLLPALGHASRVAGNLVVEDGLVWAAGRVEGGRSFAEALKEFGVLPHVVVQMAGVGERTGALDQVLDKTAAFFESEIDNRLKSLTSIIEPVMIVGLGVFIGFITLSVITPIYSLVGSVK